MNIKEVEEMAIRIDEILSKKESMSFSVQVVIVLLTNYASMQSDPEKILKDAFDACNEALMKYFPKKIG
jgi:hypothetical protein